MVEVHIPKKKIWGRLEPAPTCAADPEGLPDDLRLLQELKEREMGQIAHLEISNQQLAEFLDAEDDPEFRTAIDENLDVLVRKRQRLEEIDKLMNELTLASSCSVSPVTGLEQLGPVQRPPPQAAAALGGVPEEHAAEAPDDAAPQAVPEGLDL